MPASSLLLHSMAPPVAEDGVWVILGAGPWTCESVAVVFKYDAKVHGLCPVRAVFGDFRNVWSADVIIRIQQ